MSVELDYVCEREHLNDHRETFEFDV